jgi:hypothetical protein
MKYRNSAMGLFNSIQGNGQLSEFEKFDEKDFSNHNEELEILYTIIEEMKIRGAKQHYFKFEGPANALPRVDKIIWDKNHDDFGLRLYCVRLTDNIVILLNGGIKTKRDPKFCPNVSKHFKNAVNIARNIDHALQHQLMRLNNNRIEFTDEEFQFEI